MAAEAAKAGSSAAPTLGPSFGGSGAATRAELLPLHTKHTELGWGVVHFYREGEEIAGLDTLDLNDDGTEDGQASGAEAEDFTTLCIPAVPAYMSPEDILGFLGEQGRENISHCRLVMTSRMNRYLVILKFRDSERAKQWRKEFDGRVFNAMEVSTLG